MKQLESYLAGRWQRGSGDEQTLVNPTTEEPVATSSTKGLDLGAALVHARQKGNPALRELSFKQRAQLIDGAAKALHAAREELLDLAVLNGGNTRGDAKFDVDGAIGTLAHYARLGETLGDGVLLKDGEPDQLGKSPRFVGRHIYAPLTGVAVHVNAFNFPAWGMAEKAALAWLAGMPVLTKPASSTALVTWRMVQLLADKLPEGALQLVCGSVGSLLEQLTGQDVIAFTGSADTAQKLRALPSVLGRGTRINVEADSLNAAVLGPDVDPSSDTYALFLREVARDVTQKAGQKCTAVRRIFVARERLADVRRDLAEAVQAVKVGDPGLKEVGVGPLATAQQLQDVRAGIARLCEQAEKLIGDGGRGKLVGVDGERGYFVSPVLLEARRGATAVHEHEVFGPVATLLSYENVADAVAQVQRGQGGLVASVYSDDADFVRPAVLGIAPFHGRLHLGSAKMAEQSTGPGTVLPQLVHGGPGRAGGGEELGGTRALRFYMQRTALQGFAPALEALVATPS